MGTGGYDVCYVSAAHVGSRYILAEDLWVKGAKSAFQRLTQTAGTAIACGLLAAAVKCEL